MADNWIPMSDGELELLECESKRGSPMARLMADLRRTREALREAREDTARLDWLIEALKRAWQGGDVRSGEGLYIRPSANGHGPRYCGGIEGESERSAIDAARADGVLVIAAPLLEKCRECGGGFTDDSNGGLVRCDACHGKGSVERADIAAIRKRFAKAPHYSGCPALGRWPKFIAEAVWNGLNEKTLAHIARLEAELAAAKRVIDASRCIRHWHDSGPNNEGMVVSAEHVRALWITIADYDAARSPEGTEGKDKDEGI